jgi:hypothetical protein
VRARAMVSFQAVLCVRVLEHGPASRGNERVPVDKLAISH